MTLSSPLRRKENKSATSKADHWWVEGMGHDLPPPLWPDFADRIMALESK